VFDEMFMRTQTVFYAKLMHGTYFNEYGYIWNELRTFNSIKIIIIASKKKKLDKQCSKNVTDFTALWKMNALLCR